MLFRLDERDARLLQLLDLNARATLASLAKALRISKPAVKRRLERLEEVGVIRRYIAIINPAKLGYTIYKVNLKMVNMDDEELAAFGKRAEQLRDAGWVLASLGRWDFILLIFSQDAASLADTYRDLLEPVAQNLSRKSFGAVSSISHLPHDCLLSKPPKLRERIQFETRREKVELDELDRKLLNALSLNARATLVSLAAKLGVTPKTVKTRMRHLETRGVILGYNAVLNTSRLGWEHHKIFLRLDHLDRVTYAKLRGYVESLPATVLVTESLGISDFSFDVKVPTTSRLHEIIHELRNRFKGVLRDAEPLLITDENIIDYTPFL